MGRRNTNGKEMDEFRKHLKEFRESIGLTDTLYTAERVENLRKGKVR